MRSGVLNASKEDKKKSLYGKGKAAQEMLSATHPLRILACGALLLMLALTGCDRDSGNSAGEQPGKAVNNLRLSALPGEELTRKRCGGCHHLDRHLRKVGPSLKGVYGRVPSIDGVPFEAWDEAALDAWIEDPTGIKPGTFMAIPGIKSAEERRQIIDFLKRNS